MLRSENGTVELLVATESCETRLYRIGLTLNELEHQY